MEVAQGIVVVAQPRPCNCAVLVSHSVYWIYLYCRREVLLGAEQIVEVVLGHPAQKISFVRFSVYGQHNVEGAYGFAVLVVDELSASHPEKVGLVVLRRCVLHAAQAQNQKQRAEEFAHDCFRHEDIFRPKDNAKIRFVVYAARIEVRQPRDKTLRTKAMLWSCLCFCRFFIDDNAAYG